LNAHPDLPVPEETGATFAENAQIKALAASQHFDGLVLADDSGLELDALGGAPGVHSAYYAGHEGGREQRDARNNEKLLRELGERRAAHYCCVIVFLRHENDPRPLIAEGIWRGEIARIPRGSNGFGYDPLFMLPAVGKTAAELDAEEKNRISHRGIALAKLITLLNENRGD
ncbi:MAG TPA: RdgB/HAM1 family non-canonical purine NTP pyrophosphatase, partial [Burkholderiales bacterium]|nr:RdgB/HAM1 family non-canonical purine NTP pyrophosphatase [Burkholderiales bacterium]